MQKENKSSLQQSQNGPPIARKIPKEIVAHGDARCDNYFWMREIDDPCVIDYIKAENEYTSRAMQDCNGLEEKLYQELVSRIKETDSSVPVRSGKYYYYSRTEKGKQYRIYCRKEGSVEAREEIILDVNVMAEGHSYCSLGAYEPSPDHSKLLYSVDFDGSESYTILIRDLESGELLPDRIVNTGGECLWAEEGKTIFYTMLDDTKRPYRLFRHTLGQEQNSDLLVYSESDGAFFLHISKSRSKKYIILRLRSNTTTEAHYLQAENPEAPLRLIAPRRQGIEYYVFPGENEFFIVTNENAENFKVMRVSVDDPAPHRWAEMIAHRKEVLVEKLESFKCHLVVLEREMGQKKIRVINLSSGNEHYITFPEEVYSIWTSGNWEFETELLRFNYESLTAPESVFDYDMNTTGRVLLKEKEVIGYDRTLYTSERIFAESHDGTMVPISIVYRTVMKREGGNPLYLTGYGAYGISYDPVFSSARISLLDRGFIFAIAHVRGGEELGRSWYKDGKVLRKKNSFLDFIACAEHLIDEGYTSAQKIVASGGSAGGLLVGAAMTMRPDLWGTVVAYVPFVDVVTTTLDPSLPLVVIEYEEWGNPNLREHYEYLKSYSPYDKVEEREYPATLVITGLNDPRVMFWEPLKWTAKLRECKTDSNLLLLKVNLGAGHSGASGRYDNLRETAFEYAFIMKVFGMCD